MVNAQKLAALHKRMADLELKESDFEEKFVRASGRGGQKVNKTASCVFLKHLPTGLSVKCQREREREINRFIARRDLCDLYEEKILGKPPVRRLNRQDLLRRRKQRRAKRARLAAKESPPPKTQDPQ